HLELLRTAVEFRAVDRLDERLDRVPRAFGDAGRIGAHVGDQALRAFGAEVDAFVQRLGRLHRLAHAELQLARGLLLQGRSREGRGRVAARLPLLDRRDDERRVREVGYDL